MSIFNLLIIEDDDDHAELIDFAIKKTGKSKIIHRCIDGGDACQHVQKIKENESLRPDLILLDINIPKISGLEVLKKIKSLEELIDIPVVIFTTSNSVHDKHNAYKNHANSFLVKSTDFQEFSQTIDEMINYWSKLNKV